MCRSPQRTARGSENAIFREKGKGSVAISNQSFPPKNESNPHLSEEVKYVEYWREWKYTNTQNPVCDAFYTLFFFMLSNENYISSNNNSIRKKEKTNLFSRSNFARQFKRVLAEKNYEKCEKGEIRVSWHISNDAIIRFQYCLVSYCATLLWCWNLFFFICLYKYYIVRNERFSFDIIESMKCANLRFCVRIQWKLTR